MTALPPGRLDAKTERLRAARLEREASQPKPKPEPRNAHYRVLGLRDIMPFSKHRGKTVGQMIDEDLGFVTWLLENTEFEMSPEAEDEYHSRLDPQRPRGAR